MRRLLQSSGLLVVVVVAVVAEVMRVSFPLLYDFAETIGFTSAAAVIPVLFAATVLAAPLGVLVGPGLLLLIAAGGLAAARVVMQVQMTPNLAVTMTALALGFVALSTALRVAVARAGPLTTASALFLGLALDTAISLGLMTWDAAWRTDPYSWAVGLALPLAIVAALAGISRHGGNAAWGTDSWWFAVIPGPLLALQTLFLGNPSFVASSGDLGLPTAGAIVLVGLGLAAATPALRGPGAWVAAGVAVIVTAVLTGPTGLTGWPVPLAVLAGQVAVGALVANVAVRAEQARVRPGAWRTGLGAGLGALVLVGSLLPYQISYELPLGVPQFVFASLAALVLALLARSAPARDPVTRISPLRWIAALGPIPLLAVPAWLALSWPDVEPASTDEDRLRVATYNIHSAVNWFGRLDPERIARVLENGEADAAMLQEVARGWPLAGGMDTASWLSRRLGMEFAYGTAGDHQHGNAVLANRPLLDEWSATMDRGEGSMQRGYVGVTVAVGDSTVDVWSVHLQHQDNTTVTRRAQARQLLADWDGQDRTIIGGDLNSRPGSPDIEPWFDRTGLVSAQESVGGPTWNTSPALNPDHRIDWILGTPDLRFSDVRVPVTLASDHLPVFASVRLP